MGLGIFRFIKAMKMLTDRYEGTIPCSKKLDEALELIRIKWVKKSGMSLYRSGKFQIVSDVSQAWNNSQEITMKVMNRVGHVAETMVFRVQHNQGVTTQITIMLNAVDSKATFEDFKKMLDALEDVEAVSAPASTPTATPVAEVVVDFSNTSMSDALAEFENAVNAFGENPDASTFAKVKAVKNAISQKIKVLEAKEKAAYMASMSKIDTFVNAINMQLSNPAMASSIASFASTYVSQMLVEIAQMQAMC